MNWNRIKGLRAAAFLVVGMLVFSGRTFAGVNAQGARPFATAEESLEAAAKWLEATHQNADGGYSSFSTGAGQAPSDVGGTVDALLALAAANAEVSRALGYLEANAADLGSYADQDGSTAGKLLVALAAAGEDPHDFTELDLVSTLKGHLGQNGAFAVENAFNQALAMLGLAAAGEEVPEQAVTWLLGLQAAEGENDGSWDDGFGTPGNPDATAMAVMALLGAGREADDPAVEKAIEFLRATHLPSGGWEYGAGFGENANSTALVVEALMALGEPITENSGRWAMDGQAPLDALLAWQGEQGAFQADFGEGRFDDFFSTVQAMPAVAGYNLAGGSGQAEGPALAGGDSLLPYFMIVAVILIVAATYVWYRRA